MNNHLALSL